MTSSSPQLPPEQSQEVRSVVDAIRANSKSVGIPQAQEATIIIKVGDAKLYAIADDTPTQSRFKPQSLKVLQAALTRPQDVRDYVSVSIGGQTVYETQNRSLLKDSIGLHQHFARATQVSAAPQPVQINSSPHVPSPSAPIAPTPASKAAQQEASKLDPKMTEQLKVDIKSLEGTIDRLSQRIKQLESNPQRSQLPNWMSKLQQGVTQAVSNVKARIATVVGRGLKPYTMFGVPPSDPKKMWRHYSQNALGKTGIELAAVASYRAMRDGQSRDSVFAMLRHDPQSQQHEQQGGPDAAHRYAKIAVDYVQYRIEGKQKPPKQQKQPKQQKTKQETKGKGVRR